MHDKFLIIKISDWKVAANECSYAGKYNNDSRGFPTSGKGIWHGCPITDFWYDRLGYEPLG